jgi:phage-related protein
MASVAELVVKIVADTKDAQKGVDDVASKTSKMGGAIRGAALPAAAALAGIGVGAMAAVDAASRTEQAMGGLDSVFGKSAEQMKRWAEGAAESAGLAESEYAELATVIGAQLKNAGTPMGQIGGKTDDLIRKGADLAAMFGGSTADAVSALSSALKGETDPIEKYGVSIKAADIAAAELAEQVKKVTPEQVKAAKATDKNATATTVAQEALKGMTSAQKKALDSATVQKQIMEQTADATGKFADEQDSAAGASQIAAAQYENMKSTLGTALLPIVSELAGWLGKLAGFMTENATAVQIVVGVIAVLAAGIIALNIALSVYNTIMGIVAVVSGAAWAAALLPIFLVIAAIALVVAAIVILWKKSETFRDIVMAVWNAVKVGAAAAADILKKVFEVAFTIISTYVKTYLTVVMFVFNAIKTVVTSVAGFLSTAFSAAFNAIKSAVSAVGAFIASAFQTAQSAVSAVWHAISGFVSSAADKIMGILRALPGKIKGVFSGASTMLVDIGRSIIEGLGAGIEAAGAWLQGKVQAIIDKIPEFVKKRLGIASPSKVMAAIGKEITHGIAVGMDEGLSAVTAVSEKVMKTVSGTIDKAFKNQKKVAARTAEVATAIRDETKDLRDNAKARDTNTEALKAANDVLDAAQAKYDQLAGSVTDAATAYASVTKLPDDATDANTMLAVMAARVGAVQDFAATLNQLRAAGLAESIIQDLAAAGVEGGSAQAAAILAGGPAAIAAFNALNTQLQTAAAALGASTATAMYGAGVDAAQALVDGLAVDQAELEAKAELFAKALAKAVRKALKKALRGGGGGGGNDSSTFLAPVVPITSAASATRAPAVPSTRASTSSGYAVNVTVNGAIDPEATARQIRRVLAGHDRRVGLVT